MTFAARPVSAWFVTHDFFSVKPSYIGDIAVLIQYRNWFSHDEKNATMDTGSETKYTPGTEENGEKPIK